MGILQQIIDILEPKNGEWSITFHHEPVLRTLRVSFVSRHGGERKIVERLVGELQTRDDDILEATLSELEIEMEKAEPPVGGRD